MAQQLKQIHLAAHFPGVNNTTVWSDPAAGSHIDFDSFTQFATIAERGKFDFLFLAEGLRLREQNGLIYDLDVVGRPDTFTVLAALAAVTKHLGLAGTINSTFNEPYEVARQFATLDHLSAGRAAWNVVTSWDAFTGENFRRGGFLAEEDRYERAATFLATTLELFDSWASDQIVADQAAGVFVADPSAGRFAHHDAQFEIEGRFNVPRSPQGRPVIFQAGDSSEGRNSRRRRPTPSSAATARWRVVAPSTTTSRVGSAATAVGPRNSWSCRPQPSCWATPTTRRRSSPTRSDASKSVARPLSASLSRCGIATSLLTTRTVRCPTSIPMSASTPWQRGRASVRLYRDPVATARQWRRAEAEALSIRELIIAETGRQSFIGSPATVANEINLLVQADASDGFILVPHITPAGLEPFVERVVPLLQERGVFRTEYSGTTLRDHLGLSPLVGSHLKPVAS